MDVQREPVGAGGEQEVPAPGGFEKRALVVAEMKCGFELGRLAWPWYVPLGTLLAVGTGMLLSYLPDRASLPSSQVSEP